MHYADDINAVIARVIEDDILPRGKYPKIWAQVFPELTYPWIICEYRKFLKDLVDLTLCCFRVVFLNSDVISDSFQIGSCQISNSVSAHCLFLLAS